MRHQTESSTWELVRHVLVYSTGFTLCVVEAVYGAVVSSLASRFIASGLILRVMTLLEYTVAISSAVYFTSMMVHDVWNKLKRLIR
jgi:hypothetical protein